MTNFLKIILFLIFIVSCSTNEKKADIASVDSINPNEFDAQGDIRKGDIHLIQYGFTIPFPGRDSLTKTYGFYYQDRGCSVTDTITKLAGAYNQQIIKYLSKRNGPDWYEKFNLLADSLQDKALKSL